MHKLLRPLVTLTALATLPATLVAAPADASVHASHTPVPGCNRLYVIDAAATGSQPALRLWCSNRRRISAWFDAPFQGPHPRNPVPAVTTGLIAYDSSVRGHEATFWVVDHGWLYSVTRDLNETSSAVTISRLKRV